MKFGDTSFFLNQLSIDCMKEMYFVSCHDRLIINLCGNVRIFPILAEMSYSDYCSDIDGNSRSEGNNIL